MLKISYQFNAGDLTDITQSRFSSNDWNLMATIGQQGGLRNVQTLIQELEQINAELKNQSQTQ